MIIKNLLNKYGGEIDSLDLELIISHVLDKPREFVLAHPEFKLSNLKAIEIENYVVRRKKHEPLAYILRHKEFYGLDFKVARDTLIPRPETEILIDESLILLRSMLRKKLRSICILDIGTGSGNIIISILKNLIIDSKFKMQNSKFFALDISQKALRIARHNAKKNNVDKKIKFIQSDLLNYFLKTTSKLKDKNIFIIANLPYLSQKIYSEVSPDVKNFEPKSALLSKNEGLYHYEKLFGQIKKMRVASCESQVFLEISPEQKNKIREIAKKYFPNVKITFQKDLAGKWRLCKIIQ